MNKTLGNIHFYITIIASYMIFWPMHYMGLSGVPRRYFSLENFQQFNQFEDMNKFMTIFAVIVFCAQLLFLFNFFYSIFFGKEVTDENPWEATTLEWTTPINPGHGNWPGELPEVHRWPYDYSKDGVNYIAQTVPLSKEELEMEGAH